MCGVRDEAAYTPGNPNKRQCLNGSKDTAKGLRGANSAKLEDFRMEFGVAFSTGQTQTKGAIISLTE